MTTVADVMTPGVETASATEILRDAHRAMREGDFGSMRVLGEGRLVGVLTDRDIVVRAVAERLDPAAVRVGEVASRDPVTLSPRDGVDDAMELMARHKVRRLPVVDGGRLVGVVSQADIALGAKEAKTGAVVEQISQPTSGARERYLRSLKALERCFHEPRQGREVVAPLEHGGDAWSELCRAARKLRE